MLLRTVIFHICRSIEILTTLSSHAACDDEDMECSFSGQDVSEIRAEKSYTSTTKLFSSKFQDQLEASAFVGTKFFNVSFGSTAANSQLFSRKETIYTVNDSLFKQILTDVGPERLEKKSYLYNSFVMNVTLIISIVVAIFTLFIMLVYVALRRFQVKRGLLPQSPVKKTPEVTLRPAAQDVLNTETCREVQKPVREWYV